MTILTREEITQFVAVNLDIFHASRLASLEKLKLTQVLKRKNPYLFKAKNLNTAGDLVKTLLNAHLSSQEETIFGELLEKLAVFVCGKVYGGRKSGILGIDLEFEKDEIKYLVCIKSGPNWGNSSQITKMKENFKTAKKTLNTNTSKTNIVAVNGCCYGIDTSPNKGEYLKYCGQKFWGFIAGNDNFYLDIIEPLGYQAKQRNDAFWLAYANVINIFTAEFIKDFCHKDGQINWEKIVRLNSQDILK